MQNTESSKSSNSVSKKFIEVVIPDEDPSLNASTDTVSIGTNGKNDDEFMFFDVCKHLQAGRCETNKDYIIFKKLKVILFFDSNDCRCPLQVMLLISMSSVLTCVRKFI